MGLEIGLIEIAPPAREGTLSTIRELPANEVAAYWAGKPPITAPTPDPWQRPLPEFIPDYRGEPLEVSFHLAPASSQGAPDREQESLRVEAWTVGCPVERLVVLFNLPMGAFGQMEVPADLVQLEPPVAGQWYWMDPWLLVFRLEDKFETMELRADQARFQIAPDGSCQRL